MNDRVFGIFTDQATANRAADELAAIGVARERIRVERVLEPDHRGLNETQRVHSIIHAPRIEDDDPVADDAGTVVLVVEMIEPGEDESSGDDVFDNEAMMSRLGALGATETSVVEATPGLDL